MKTMKKEWYITNIDNNQQINTESSSLIKGKGFFIYTNGQTIYRFRAGEKKVEWLLIIDGYVLPRHKLRNQYNGKSQEELIERLYKEKGNEFINFIKGNFIIIIGNLQLGFTLYTDHLGTKKVFYYHDSEKNKFILSNRFKYVSDAINTKLNLAGIVVQSLTHHYLGGLTFLEQINYTKPAAMIEFSRRLNFQQYWDCSELLKLQRNDFSPREMADSFKGIMKDYLDFFNPDKISLTLTGGLDSRTILAALLSLGCKPYTFTYGHANSPDAETAKQISRSCGIKHHNHYDIPTADWFASMSKEITDIGDSITQLHRAHRLWAVKAESGMHPDSQMLIGGYMGGESIRNFYYDGVIISDFTQRWIQENGDKKRLIQEVLSNRFIKSSNVDIDEVYEILSSQTYFDPKKEVEMKEFYMTFQLLAGNHHSQDPNLFSHYNPVPLSIYLDIDFLHLIFSSEYNFLAYNKDSGNKFKKYMNRIKGAELYCHFIEAFSPELAKIPFAKQGYYTALEYVKDPTALLVLKRAKRKFFNRSKGPVNFNLGKWIEDYVSRSLSQIEEDCITQSVYDIPRSIKQLNSQIHSDQEKYWRKFTEITWTHLNVKQYMLN